MPKLIEYPRTGYTGAWELAEVVDDTGGKCAVDTAARKLDRKVSGSFKAIIGSAVKFGLITSKRELLTTTTLFRRIKHAYDKAEELQFHQEAFLTPPLFTQLCRKFRNRELPVQMLDVILIREFGVEEINAQGVAKAFVDGCRMSGLINERNIIADIDDLNKRAPRREVSNTPPILNTFNSTSSQTNETSDPNTNNYNNGSSNLMDLFEQNNRESLAPLLTNTEHISDATDTVASLFGLINTDTQNKKINEESLAIVLLENNALSETPRTKIQLATQTQQHTSIAAKEIHQTETIINTGFPGYQMQMNGPGISTSLNITEEADITIAIALIEKVRRQLRANA